MPNLVKIYFQNPLKVLILKGLVVGLGGLEPPTSPLSEGSAIADKPYSKAFYTILEIKFPDSSQVCITIL